MEQQTEQPFQLIDALELFNRPENLSLWTIKGLLAAGATILAGDPKTGKSTLGTQLACSVASGTPFLDTYEVRQRGPVLYFLLDESTEDLRSRLQRIGGVGRYLGDIKIVERLSPKQIGEKFASSLETALHQAAYRLVVVDRLTYIREAETDGANICAQDTREMGRIQKLGADLGVPILLIHHTNKGEGRGVAKVSGSNALSGSVDSVFSLTRSGDRGSLAISSRKLRSDIIGLKMDEKRGVWVPANEPADRPDVAERRRPREQEGILTFLQIDGGTPKRSCDIEREFMGWPASSIRRHITILLKEGVIERVGRGLYSMPLEQTNDQFQEEEVQEDEEEAA